MKATLSKAATAVVGAVAAKPYTFACVAWQIGCLVAPVTTIVASVFYTGISLGQKAGEEWEAEIARAIAARQAQKEAL